MSTKAKTETDLIEAAGGAPPPGAELLAQEIRDRLS
jgi:hypothetical protein